MVDLCFVQFCVFYIPERLHPHLICSFYVILQTIAYKPDLTRLHPQLLQCLFKDPDIWFMATHLSRGQDHIELMFWKQFLQFPANRFC